MRAHHYHAKRKIEAVVICLEGVVSTKEMDLFVSDDNDPDYYVEYESGDDARDWR